MNPAERIARTLDRHLTGPADLRLLGGAALILGYGMARGTEDADLVMETSEVEREIARAGLAEALVATNDELEPLGLYVTHIWGPEQQILTPDWRDSCRRVRLDPPLVRLALSVLGPLDLITSKLCRADDGDIRDILWLVQRERLGREAVVAAIARAVVPDELQPGLDEAIRRVLTAIA